MKVSTGSARKTFGTPRYRIAIAFAIMGCALLLAAVWVMNSMTARAQPPAAAASSADVPSPTAAKPDAQIAGDSDAPAIAHTADGTPEGREREAWLQLTDAAADAKHPPTRIQALAALGLLRNERAEKMIVAAMTDPDVDVRTAAVLAAGQTRDPNMTTRLRDLLDDKEPQVVFTSAMTLWKMGDRSGEDILMSVVDGDRSASASMVHGTEHRLNTDLHNPAMLAKLGAMQGAAMLLGPFGYGITAYEYIHQNGGDLARVSAIEQISQERTEPIHRELIAALADKDQAVRAAALKALVDYHDKATVDAVYQLLIDPKAPVRLTAAAALLRTSGVPGPAPQKPVGQAMPDPGKRRHLNTPSSTKPVPGTKLP